MSNFLGSVEARRRAARDRDAGMLWAQRRSARRHGLTPKDAPLLRAPAFGPAGVLACRRWRRADHAPRVPRVPWSTWLAYRLVAEFNERRSWRRALRG